MWISRTDSYVIWKDIEQPTQYGAGNVLCSNRKCIFYGTNCIVLSMTSILYTFVFHYICPRDARYACYPGGGVTQVKTYVIMRVRKVFKWTHISEVHDQKIAPFSEPLPTGHTLNVPLFPNSAKTDTLISDLLRSEPHYGNDTLFWEFSYMHVNAYRKSGPPGPVTGSPSIKEAIL